MHTVYLMPDKKVLSANDGENLHALLQRNGLYVESPCGGKGKCKKCFVTVNGTDTLACETVIHGDMQITLPQRNTAVILEDSIQPGGSFHPAAPGCQLAIDLGTTTIVCYLLSAEDGTVLSCASGQNPQAAYGADVLTRIQAALAGNQEMLTKTVRKALEDLIGDVCRKAGILPKSIGVVCIVGNPCMQQLLMGYSVENLATFPFRPVITAQEILPASRVLPICANGLLLVVPNISGYIGSDTLACILALGMADREELSLLVDIGTNGEMVLGNERKMVACSAAAGPALEGANIHFGMCGSVGAIDHVLWENGQSNVHVIGETKAAGICGSGLIDAVAGMLRSGKINSRGRIQAPEAAFEGERACYLTEDICLTQADIRQVQLAKGAIAAGIELMAAQMDISLDSIQKVYLAGAFGSYMDPESACKIGLLPPGLLDKIEIAGNAAGQGAQMLAKDSDLFYAASSLLDRITPLELGSLEAFSRCFVKNMRF